jgi:hypothetical protein
MSPLRNAVLAQISGLIIAVAIMKIVLPQLFSMMLVASVVQGVCAAIVSHKLGAPRWWQPIHLVFAPLTLEASRLDLSPFVWMSGFLLMLLLFWRTDKSQVPLFLSNPRTAEVVATLLPEAPCEFIDLGCGTGSLLKRIAHIRPDCDFLGVEHAPLPCLWAWLSCLGNSNVTIRYGNFWNCHLGKFNIVYSFLSPVPMADLWIKAKVEMSSGGILISNSFEVPHMTATRMIEVTDRRRTRLFCYNLP